MSNENFGFTIQGMILSKEDFFSKKHNKQIYQLNIFVGGNDVVSVLNVDPEVYAAVSTSEVIALRCTVRAYANENRARLLINFKELAEIT